jgi:hypothetical protein
LGHQGLKNIRNAPAWFRGVHNYWPVLLTHAQADMISLFTNLVERDPSVSANWRAFLELVQRSDYQPEFLSAAVEWGKEAIRMLVEQYQMSLPDSNAVHVQVLMSGFWDEPKYHKRGRFNPRKVDELAALALSCRGEADASAARSFRWCASSIRSSGTFLSSRPTICGSGSIKF